MSSKDASSQVALDKSAEDRLNPAINVTEAAPANPFLKAQEDRVGPSDDELAEALKKKQEFYAKENEKEADKVSADKADSKPVVKK